MCHSGTGGMPGKGILQVNIFYHCGYSFQMALTSADFLNPLPRFALLSFGVVFSLILSYAFSIFTNICLLTALGKSPIIIIGRKDMLE